MSRRLPALLPLLLTIASVAGAAPLQFGNEVPFAPAQIDAAPKTQQWPKIAGSGNQFLVVWTDFRGGIGDLYGARIGADGTLLDPADLRIARRGRSGVVAWNGRRYVVVHQSFSLEIAALTVTTEGQMSGALPVLPPYYPPAIDSHYDFPTGAASNGDTTLVVTSFGRSVLLDQIGRPLREVALDWPANAAVPPMVASDGRDYLVIGSLATTPPQLLVRRVSANGEVTEKRATNGVGSWNASHTFGRDRYLLVWPLYRGLQGVMLERDGTVAGGVLNLATFPDGGEVIEPRAVWRGDEFIVVFGRRNASYAVDGHTLRVSADGVPQGPAAPFGSTAEFQATDAASIGDGRTVAAFIPGSSQPLSAVLIAGQASATAAFVVARSAHVQEDVAIAPASGTPLVAWTEIIPGTGRVVRVAHGDASATVATLKGYTGFSTAPVGSRYIGVATDSGVVWVWWVDAGQLYVRRLSVALQPIDAAPIKLAFVPLGDVAAAAGGGKLLIAWTANEIPLANPYASDIQGSLLDGTAALPGEPLMLAGDTFHDHLPSLAWDGSAFVLAWIHTAGPVPSDEEIRVIRISTAGVASGRQTVATRPFGIDQLRVAAGAAGATAVAWRESSTFGVFAAVSNGGGVRTIATYSTLEVAGLLARAGGYLLQAGGNQGRSVDLYRLAADASLIDRTSLPLEEWSVGTPRAGLVGSLLVLAYARRSDLGDADGVPRAFLRWEASAPRRRTVR